MSSERQCGLGSLLPMSCRGRAEAFARRLHTRLRRLGSDSREEPSCPPCALAARHLDSDVYFDFDGGRDSPSSPAEEVTEGELAAIVSSLPARDPETGCAEGESPPSNSDSDATYYDLDADQEVPSARVSDHRKYARLHEDAQLTRNVANLTKLKLASSEMRDQLIQYKPPSPERQSPAKTLPPARENGYADYAGLERRDSQNSLYSPINFDDCQKRNSLEKEMVNGGKSEVDPVKVIGADANSDEKVPHASEDYDEPDFCRPISLTNGAHENALQNNKINNHIEAERTKCTLDSESSPSKEAHLEAGLEEGIVKEVNEPNSTDETVVETEREGKQGHLEKLDFSNIENNDSSEECRENLNGDIDAEGDDRPQRVRRCSSLRTGKTPPGTPGRKKIVRFADVLGLDLADVKTFMDDIPNIPKSAFEDLRDADFNASSTESIVTAGANSVTPDKSMVCLFQQPGDLPSFLDILNARSTCLENAYAQDGSTCAISGVVRVRNLDFHKSVQIRYSIDSWKTFSDLQASYVPNSCDGFSDRFQFVLYAHTLMVGQRLEFAVRFMCKGCQFWDNNLGANYCFQCVPYGTTTTNFFQPKCITPVDTWQGSFY